MSQMTTAKPKKKTKQTQCVCLRCGWGKNPGEWVQRKKNGKPARCPHCFSAAWNKPKRTRKQFVCLRCGWGKNAGEWQSHKQNGEPLSCPRCGSRSWKTPSSNKPISLKPPGLE